MGTNSYDLNESGYALCSSCRKKFFIRDLVDKCGICDRWFCKDCARPTPPSHGCGEICKNCYTKIKSGKM